MTAQTWKLLQSDLVSLAALGTSIQPWMTWYDDQEPLQLERHLRLDAYQAAEIAPWPQSRVFNEAFCLQDLYVPLKAQRLSAEGEPDLDQPPVLLEKWVKTQLDDPASADQVLVVQGGFGRGKTTFCRMFADWLRRHEYPRWIPVLIPLQQVKVLTRGFEALLQQMVPAAVTQNDPDWLTRPDTRFVFVLDGFSELHFDHQISSLEQFFQELGKFQESCASHPEMGHRVVVTGRCLMIQTLSRLLPPNLSRVEILPLDPVLQDRWLTRWQQLTGADADGLRQILTDSHLSKASQALTYEPLMLYFLAAMHRDGELQVDFLQEPSPARAKFLLYQKIFYWALNQRPGLLQRNLSAAETESLRRLLAEAGLIAVQTGTQTVDLAQIRLRLQHDEDVQALLAEMDAQLTSQPLTSALVTLCQQSSSQQLDFTHNSFSKLFCSRRLHEALQAWSTRLTRRQNPEPLVPAETLYWEIFDLLGYGGLTFEMTEYLLTLLNANPEFDLSYLFHRLEDFYRRWCAGAFMDRPPETYPQRAMRQLEQNPNRFVALGQRQVDVYAGLNVMILLLQLHGYARSHGCEETVAFYPCGLQGMPDFEPDRLLRIIGYAHAVSPTAFRAIVGPYLNSAHLSGVNLTGVNLSGVDLSAADLRGADLSGANLQGANLSRINLVGANLNGADLSNADLRGANLIGAYLRGAALSSASLSGADLSSANLIGASLSRSDLRDADLSGAYLRGASLQSADLSRAYLIGASLSGACLSNAELSQVDLSDANLHGADLSDVNLRGADLSGADLIGAYLSGASLCGARLCNASLNSADLIDADLCGADLSSANLFGADLSDQAVGEVKWSDRTKWQDVRGLEAAINVPEALKQQLGLTGN